MKKVYEYNNRKFNELMQKKGLVALNGVIMPHHVVEYMMRNKPQYMGDINGPKCGAAATAHYLWQFSKEKYQIKKELFDALVGTLCIENNDDGTEGIMLDSGIQDLLPSSGYIEFPEKYHEYDGMYFHYIHRIDPKELAPTEFDEVAAYLRKQKVRQIVITLDGPDSPTILIDVANSYAGFSYYNKPDAAEFIRKVLVPLIGLLQYLVIDDADITGPKWMRVDAYRPNRGGGGIIAPRKKANLNIIGENIAKKLSDAETICESTGRKVKPHLRKAHWHRYRYGPGRSLVKLKWMYTILVGA